MSNGRTLDIWSLPKEQTIKEHVSTYAHKCDMLYWNVRNKNLGYPSQEIKDQIESRTLSLNDQIERGESSVAYFVVKSLYLTLRHQFKLDKSASDFLSQNIDEDRLLTKNTIRLIQELQLCGMQSLDSNLVNLKGAIESADVVKLFYRYWKAK